MTDQEGQWNLSILYAELQIRGGTEDNSNIIFLFLNKNICCGPSLEPSY